MIISFLGPDGCGKSTLINVLESNLKNTDVTYFHLRPIVPKKNVSNNSPQQSKTYGFVLSFLKLCFLILQFNIGWLKNIRGRKGVIIFDRYLYDVVIDPKRFRISLPAIILKIGIKLIPKPDIIFLLTGDPVVINERKKEVSLKETKRQMNLYDTFINGDTVIKVNSCKGVDECKTKMLNAISM